MFKKTLLSLAMTYALSGAAISYASEIASSLHAGEKAISAGALHNAISLLQQAQQQAKQPKEQWLASAALAEAYLRAGQLESAEAELKKTYQVAKNSAPAALIGDLQLRYGHLESARGQAKAAENWYRQALSQANKAQDYALATAANINIAKLSQQPQALTAAAQQLAKVKAGETRNELALALAYQAMQQQQIEQAHDLLQSVLTATQQPRTKAQALGYLGQLYEQQQRYPEALQLTEQALAADAAADLHLQWDWQRGRILQQQGQQSAALGAYRSAVQQLKDLRADIPVVYHDGQSSFKQTFAPIYQGFIDLLLQQAAATPATKQDLLQETVDTWEQLKAVELQDYFKDACSVKQKAQLSQLEDHTAVLYPIVLPDYLALVLRTNKGIQAYRVEQKAAALDTAVRRLNEQLLSGAKLSEHKTLYRWVIAPLEADLKQQQIDTLVYLPDGALRKVPFSLLHDGNGFLVERYALVTIPGLSMLAAPTKDQSRQDILLSGMSEPGPVVDELLDSGINLFEPPKQESRGLAKRALHIRSAEATRLLNPAERNLRASQLKQELALPGVNEELKALAKLSSQPVMENDSFLLNAFKQTVNQGHVAVHIASHGYFSGDPKKSFVMTYDHLLNMEQLSALFQTEAFHDRPIELVTLSACQTAEGDDRSPLGLSGVVVQTGVKSAIGTLWPVADEAARQFFADFYQQYQQSGMTKAKAMQYAQQQLMKNKELNNPAYWGPFVLVGEWH